ncbi:hypothetical protein BDM02DRAFT_3117367 [Thelephora ganbajun]|uniref:Uncharacterized protein n=1 Tax=Thelephora ganbajun TaxID=370292 RepID=A0ACB6ZCF0_THEGA|nr:hypothetical protein BDM02DRAFT_3117367 [Thelephora ganbajun]
MRVTFGGPLKKLAACLYIEAPDVLRFYVPDLVTGFAIFAQQNDGLGAPILQVFRPSQFGEFPCEEGCSFLVLLRLAATGYIKNRFLLVHRNNRNLSEEFHTMEYRYLWASTSTVAHSLVSYTLAALFGMNPEEPRFQTSNQNNLGTRSKSSRRPSTSFQPANSTRETLPPA